MSEPALVAAHEEEDPCPGPSAPTGRAVHPHSGLGRADPELGRAGALGGPASGWRPGVSPAARPGAGPSRQLGANQRSASGAHRPARAPLPPPGAAMAAAARGPARAGTRRG